MYNYNQLLDDINDEINTTKLKSNGLREELNVELWKARWERGAKLQATYNRPELQWHDMSPKGSEYSGGSFKHGPGKVMFRYQD